MNDWLRAKPKRHIREIPLAPVLDLLTVVIFFLILSTSFTELTQQTLPPSSVHVLTTDSERTPLNPKLVVIRQGGTYALNLHWAGEQPGQVSRTLAVLDTQSLRSAAADLAGELKTRFPSESNLQLGLGGNTTYQELIAVMDGVREHVQDLVLMSPALVVGANP